MKGGSLLLLGLVGVLGYALLKNSPGFGLGGGAVGASGGGGDSGVGSGGGGLGSLAPISLAPINQASPGQLGANLAAAQGLSIGPTLTPGQVNQLYAGGLPGLYPGGSAPIQTDLLAAGSKLPFGMTVLNYGPAGAIIAATSQLTTPEATRSGASGYGDMGSQINQLLSAYGF